MLSAIASVVAAAYLRIGVTSLMGVRGTGPEDGAKKGVGPPSAGVANARLFEANEPHGATVRNTTACRVASHRQSHTDRLAPQQREGMTPKKLQKFPGVK
jgi:hypothetical protein